MAEVTLVIRAPNQQIADYTVQCCIDWSVRNLKDYLSEVYPSKPKREDQKLIYFGQLLTDNTVLKDILRTYEGQENYTIHLVCRTVIAKEKRVKTDTRREAGISASSPLPESVSYTHSINTVQFPDQNIPFNWGQAMPNLTGTADFRYIWPAISTPMSNFNNPTMDMNQQITMMQQAYAQYLSQYMEAMEHYFRSPVSQQFNETNSSQLSSNNVANFGVQLPQNERRHNDAVPPRPNDNNNNNNNPARNAAANDLDEDENRDWLDWFYVLSRILILFSIVYFYSSPTRFFLVSVLAFAIYLYHMGFFTQFGNARLNNNNNINYNDMQQRLAANEMLLPAVPPVDDVNNNRNERNNNNHHYNNVAEENVQAATAAEDHHVNERLARIDGPIEQDRQEPNHPSAVTLVWTILRTFVLSLIPEQQNVM